MSQHALPPADHAARERKARHSALAALAVVALLSLAYCFLYAVMAGTPVDAADSLYWVVADWGIWFLLGPFIVREVLRLHAAGGTRREAARAMLPRLAACVALALLVRAGFGIMAEEGGIGFLLFKRLPVFVPCALAFAACAFWQVRPELVRMAPPAPAPRLPVPERPALVVQSARGEHRLPLAEIGHIEACGNYLEVRAAGAAYLLRQTMKVLEEQLAGSALVRCHRSYFVNLEHIEKFELRPSGNHVLLLRDGACVPVSKAYRDTVRATMGSA